jgi:hypothetical protein
MLYEAARKLHGIQGGLQVFRQISQEFSRSGWILTFCGPGNSLAKYLLK